MVGEVLRLPAKLHGSARKLYATNPVAAARLAEVALMIDLFWLTLLRRRNMAGLHLDRHLCRDRKGAIIGVVIPGDEVKNGMILDIPLGKRIADRIERHISMYRPLISGADDGRWLFPGVGGRPRNGASLTRRVREVIETHCGVRLTPHGFRHLGYMLLAQLDPQATASASHLLGHTSQKTSERAYGGLRTLGAFKSYDRVLADSDDTAFDCGAVTTALVNAAWSRGLGAVINSQGIMQSPVVREHAGIADDQVIMKAVALGWPDESFPANAVVSERKSVDEAATFLGFED